MNVNKHILTNGLRILTIPMKEQKTATIYILVETGARDETKENNGISHFLEHMCFKGTINRPGSFLISKELEALGSQYNAFTSYEYTGYYAKSHSSHIRELIDIVSDIYLNSTLPEQEFEKERGVIIEEINMYNDRPDYVAGEIYRSMIYGDIPLGRPIAGTIETVRGLTQSALAAYHQQRYTASNTVVIVAGEINEASVLADIEQAFKNIKTGEQTKRIAPETAGYTPLTKITEKQSDQTHIVLGTPAYHASHPDRYALSLLSSILGGGMSSRLFQKLREDMGAAYYVYASTTYGTDHGDFEVAAGIDKNRAPEIITAIVGELKRMIQEDVHEEELSRVKEYIIGSLYLGLESSDAFASYYGGLEIMHRPLELPEEKEKHIRSVTTNDIRRVATDILSGRKLTISIVGPHLDIPGLEDIVQL